MEDYLKIEKIGEGLFLNIVTNVVFVEISHPVLSLHYSITIKAFSSE